MKQLRGKTVTIFADNIDTDILIPKNFLKTVKRTGFEDALFFPWRYDEKGVPLQDFPLNRKEGLEASILITGENFGCGSSREHAAWALKDFGIKAVIAGGFSPIFYMNFINNNCIPVVLDRGARENLSKEKEVTVDLVHMVVIGEKEYPFTLEESFRYRLLEDLDAIGETLLYEKNIEEYERRRGI